MKNKMIKNFNIGQRIANIFKDNWREFFVFDSLNSIELTYEDFFKRILFYKKKLKELNIKNSDAVALIVENSLELMILYFAGFIAGIRVVPIDPQKGIDEIKLILSQIECEAIIADDFKNNFSVENVIRIDEFKKMPLDSKAKEDANIFYELDYKKVYLVAFTSGSTGVPKGVMHSFENLIKSALSFSNSFNFGKENVFYHNLPMTYMAGFLNQILLPFISESKIVIGERFSIANVSNFWHYPIKYSVNTFWLNPTILALLMKLDRGKEGVEYAARSNIISCVGTAPLSCRLREEFKKKYKIALFESYGLSETLFISTEQPNKKKLKGSVGRVLEGTEVSFGDDGEIIIDTEWMFFGYANIESKDALKDNKFLSGDLGHLDKDGNLFITGRKKDLIIKGGINISPSKIEEFINNYDYFSENVIMGIEDEIFGEKIVCFYAPRKDRYNQDSVKIINNNIMEKFGKDHCVDEFFLLDEIPKNINGKVDKLKIKEIYKSKYDNKN